jgi:enolase|eukprot:CAMPEP_0174285184 /NCGR_PEP_ID=MMETSP0809-20121228/7977_1 /TAXON_ID=73025 ORGANISM="Eutreptiella gymnastica-like, Strain CCMP1594" /NCGR_SAMPLE_ID=MMETSP0809 /ASSEMBLY_ACC=CAM_ASM_000658 /LENGTH=431 /DNA_ID=CAMNT_0015380883 /DNA_START=22 /DNA_END=1317 /DNA_ORIENTATION=+
MPVISKVHARQILDSRGNPTVEVDVTLDNGMMGRGAVPSGASTGEFEAVELRDGDKGIYMGKGVLKSVEAVNTLVAPKLVGMDPAEQLKIDNLMMEIDGTPNKAKVGANGILGVSMACCRAAALVKGVPLFKHIADLHGNTNFRMPVPMCNIINGGKHADNKIDFQEFMVMPVGAPGFAEGLRWCTEIFHHLKSLLKKAGHVTSVGDEGGFAPNCTNDEALEYVMKAITAAGYEPGKQIGIALDCASSELFDEGDRKGYKFWKSAPESVFNAQQMVDKFADWVSKYPIVSIEDPLDQNDWDGYVNMTKSLGGKTQIVGDDFFVTNPTRFKKGIDMAACNSILIKVNQIGTVSETLECIKMGQAANYGIICSHRSGETEDAFISDLAVGTAAGQIKTGSLSRTDRMAKYNQLIRIEEELAGASTWDTAMLKK